MHNGCTEKRRWKVPRWRFGVQNQTCGGSALCKFSAYFQHYCIDTTYSSGQVTRDVLEGIENSSKPWRTRDETQNLSLQDKILPFLVVLKPPRREKFLSRSSNLVGTRDIRPISSLRRRLWRVTRRVGRIITVYSKILPTQISPLT